MKLSKSHTSLRDALIFTAAMIGSASLVLATPQAEPSGDSEVAEFIQMDVRSDPNLEGARIKVAVDDEIAFLTGSADSLAQTRRATERTIASVGVRAVVNQVKISPKPAPEILRATKSALAGQSMIASDGIRVSVSGHQITLEGSVGTLTEKDLALDIVSGVPGVVTIDNKLTVDGASTRTDAQIEEQIHFLIQSDPLCEGLDLIADVKSGVVRLRGEVGTRGEIDRLTRRSRVEGVSEVKASGLSSNRNLAMEGVADKNYSKDQALAAIREAIAADSRIQSEPIKVGMDGGTVTLSGTVRELAQSNAAEFTARAIPGVVRVSNELKVKDGAETELATGRLGDVKAASAPLVLPPR